MRFTYEVSTREGPHGVSQVILQEMEGVLQKRLSADLSSGGAGKAELHTVGVGKKSWQNNSAWTPAWAQDSREV